MAELKSRPFCGEHLVKETDTSNYVHPKNDCFLASADCEFGAVFVYSDEIEAWNRRADNG